MKKIVVAKGTLATLVAQFILRKLTTGPATLTNSAGAEEGLNSLISSTMETDAPGSTVIKNLMAETGLYPATHLICGNGSEKVGKILADIKGLQLITTKGGVLYDVQGNKTVLPEKARVILFVTSLTDADILAPLLKKISGEAWVLQVCCFLNNQLPIAKQQLKGMELEIVSMITLELLLEVAKGLGIFNDEEINDIIEWQQNQSMATIIDGIQ